MNFPIKTTALSTLALALAACGDDVADDPVVGSEMADTETAMVDEYDPMTRDYMLGDEAQTRRDAFDADDCDTCAEDGVLGAMVGWVGSFAAMQAIRVLLCGVSALGDPQWGTLHLMEGLSPAMRSFQIAKDPACKGCGSAA